MTMQPTPSDVRIRHCAPAALVGLGVVFATSFGCDDKRAEPAKSSETPAAAQPASAATGAAPKDAAPALEPTPEPPRGPKKPLNVLLLTVDALRADMPWAGYSREIAPHLTQFAKEAVVYDQYRSVSSYTAQTVATLLTGKYASTLYRQGYFFTGYSEHNEFITEVMQQKGVRTMGLHAHLYFGRGKGLEQGFDVWETVKGITFDAQTDNHVTSDKSVTRIIELLSDPENVKGQFFLWSHLMDPHDKYIKHKESPDFGDKNRDRYDSEVWFTDMWLGKLFEFGRTQPWWDDTAIIVSADHGEAFGEHGMHKHAFELWEVLVRIPLLVKAPGAEPRRISEPRTHIDMAPTVMELMGLEPPAGVQGQSLVKEIYGAEEPKKRDVIVMELAEDTHNPHRRAIVQGDYKLIVFDTGWQKLLFNLKDDPGEENDLSKKEPEKLAQMSALFDETFAKIPSVPPYGGMKLKSGKLATGPSAPPDAKKGAPKGDGASKGSSAAEKARASQP
jgi:arylsulfatase A-like enzyme